jgi:ubiquinone/menaquinone biosynthesis C-methylase UbiE
MVAGSVDFLPFRGASFDLVCVTDVIEYLDDDVAALAGMRRVTVPDGHLLLTVPAYQVLLEQQRRPAPPSSAVHRRAAHAIGDRRRVAS